MPRTAPYGTWTSPVTLDRLVEDVVGLSFPMATRSHVYWVEARPKEGGRQVLVRMPSGGGAPVDVLPPDFNARTAVHEYGGRCAAVHSDPDGGDIVYVSNFDDQRIYRIDPGAAPVPITPEPPSPRAYRYGVPLLTVDGRHLVAVRERHAEPDVASGVVNDVVILPTDGSSSPRTLVSGHDFYGHLARSPDGARLCWVSWDHPDMPWDGTELWEGELDVEHATVRASRLVAGGPSESVTQPAYGADGTLHYVSDRSGWWNLYAERDAGAGSTERRARPLGPLAGEFGMPDFVLGLSSYALLADGSILATWRRGGMSHLGELRPGAQAWRELDAGFTHVGQLLGTDDRSAALAVAGSASSPSSVVRITPGEDEPAVEVLRTSRSEVVDPAYLSTPVPVEFPTEGDETAHGLYYPPVNPDFTPPEGELPPLLVSVHGGPTSAAVPVLDYAIQFWTSRGFALVDVNHAGSTGYGRAYRDRLLGQWGVLDVRDCVHAVRFLATAGRADADRAVIHGKSAGGYTTLCAATLTGAFAAAASYYGIADATVLAEDAHKFESHYMDRLFGPWPTTEDLYRERSPVRHTACLRTPLIVFQGLEDKVVPPVQAEMIVSALRDNGVPHAYLPFEGEQHGFRRAVTVRRTTEAELYFYGRVLGFTPADELEPVEIVHEDRIPR